MLALALLALLAAPPRPVDDTAVVWVFFADKGIPTTAIADALEDRARELSPRALARRRRVRHDAGVDARDLPIAPASLHAITSLGLRIRVQSRWLNAVSVEAPRSLLPRLSAIAGVQALRPVARGERIAPAPMPQDGPPPLDPTYGLSLDQLTMIGVPDLHACGLTGEGVVVGVLDSGFVLDHVVFSELDVIAAHDFIHDDDIVSDEPGDPPDGQLHGSLILSLLAGRDEGTFMGAAPDVSVILAKTEDVSQEVPAEEDFYVAGLEWIESMGADMSTSSLGYFLWYAPDQLDGQTAVTTMAANVALDNGLVMFSAMGNTGPNPSTLNAPADADRLVSIGAVQPDGVIAGFSSRGPTADGRIKPDVCASGNPVWVVDIATPDQYTQASGTSVSTPLAAGVGALLLQAYPDLTPQQMADLLRNTASAAAMPDNDQGWGIVQGLAAAGLYCTCHDDDHDGAFDIACGGDDCNDGDASIEPGATEACNGMDDDCDATTPADEVDVDGDGTRLCAGDCDDADAGVGPDAVEVCDDGVDNDCDAAIDLDDSDCGVASTGADTSGESSGGASIGSTATGVTTLPPDTAGSGDDSSEGGASASADGGGCGCTHDGRTSLAWLVVLFAARRRRGSAGREAVADAPGDEVGEVRESPRRSRGADHGLAVHRGRGRVTRTRGHDRTTIDGAEQQRDEFAGADVAGEAAGAPHDGAIAKTLGPEHVERASVLDLEPHDRHIAIGLDLESRQQCADLVHRRGVGGRVGHIGHPGTLTPFWRLVRATILPLVVGCGAAGSEPGETTGSDVTTAPGTTTEATSLGDSGPADATGSSASTAAADTSSDGSPGVALATIIFPPPSSTIAASVPVRGRASAPDPIVAVRVAGVAATTTDDFATWRADVPLELGANAIEVEIDTAQGTSVVASVDVTRADDYASLTRGDANRFGEVFDGLFSGAESIAWDPALGRVLVVDNWGDGLYAIDVATGDHTTISYSEQGDLTRGNGPELTAPREGDQFVMDDAMLIIDTPEPTCDACSALFAIDLASGDRTIAVDFGAGGTQASDIVADPRSGNAWVLGYSDLAIWTVDPHDGARTQLSGAEAGAGDPLIAPISMALDASRMRLVVAQQYQDFFAAVDLATGDRTVFSPAGGTGPAFDDPRRLAISSIEDELYLLEQDGDPTATRLLAVELEGGDRRELTVAGDGMDPVPMTGLAAYEHGLLVMTGYALFVVDPALQVKVVVSR